MGAGAIQQQNLFLQRLKAIFDQIPVPTKLEEPTPEAPTTALLVGFDAVGKYNNFVQMEFSFVMDPELFVADNLAILQTFATIRKDVDVRRLSDLHWLIGQINNYMPLGYFGIMDTDRTIYMKANTLFVGELVTDQHIRHIDHQTGLVFYSINLFYDLIGLVADGKADAREAWEQFDFTVIGE